MTDYSFKAGAFCKEVQPLEREDFGQGKAL